MSVCRITAAALERMKGKAVLWDTEVKGFGARRQTDKGDIIFVWKGQSPVSGKQVFLTIGRWGRGDWGIDDARRRATEYRDAVRLGRDPAADRDAAKATMTVAELAADYQEAAPKMLLRSGRPKKASTIATDKARIAHIVQLLGDLRVQNVTHAHVETFMHRLAAGATAQQRKPGKVHGSVRRGGKGVATRTVGLLGAIFAFGVKRGLRADNPAHGVTKFAENRRERRLTGEEYLNLGKGLKAARETMPVAADAIRFLSITGWRRGEAATLTRSAVDATRRVAILADTKSGRSIRPLSHAALALIEVQPRLAGNDHVFPALTGKGGTTAIPRGWAIVREQGVLAADIVPHVLRHSFASEASDLGLSEASIAELIGHKRQGITASYVHRADAVLLAAADAVADRVLELLRGAKKPTGKTVRQRKAKPS